MSNAKHTPGPWKLINGHKIVQDSGNRLNVGEYFEAPGLGKAASANAQLIAAAPELLDILKLILGAHDTKNNGAYMGEAVLCHHYAEVARAAIAKAEGTN